MKQNTNIIETPPKGITMTILNFKHENGSTMTQERELKEIYRTVKLAKDSGYELTSTNREDICLDCGAIMTYAPRNGNDYSCYSCK